ncbi:MAG: globin-coupled sensor protein [Dehalococcoidia bacterium]
MTSLTLVQRLGITPEDRKLRFDWTTLSERDSQLIRDAARFVAPAADDIVRKFYDHSMKFEGFTTKLVEAGSNRGRLEAGQKQYLLMLLEAKFDEAYFEYRLLVGTVHARLHVEPRWNLGNYGMYLQLITDVLAKKLKGDTLRDTILAFQKAFTLDMTLVIESYIQGLLDRLVDVNETLEVSSGELLTGANQAHIASREIATAIQDIAKGATEQTMQMGALTDEMRSLSESIDAVATGAEEQYGSVQVARDAADQVGDSLANVAVAARGAAEKGATSLEAAHDGMTSVQQTVDAMATIRGAVLTTSTEIEELGKRGTQIGAIVQVIDDIASQTNLLALNAAIEAARAGEQGRGFAVVAENVRSLAERTAVATKEIGALISAVQQGTDRAVKAMNASVRDVETGAARAEQAGEALNRIVESANDVTTEIGRIAAASDEIEGSARSLKDVVEKVGVIGERMNNLAGEMRSASERAFGSITSVTAFSEESAAASEQVSASIEEVTAQVGVVSDLAQKLETVSLEMGDFLTRWGNLTNTKALAKAA